MRTRVTYATLLIILSVWQSGCRRGDAPAPGTVRDDLDRPVEVDLPATRVVTFAPNLTELVFSAGAGERLVGVGLYDDYPPEVADLSRFSTYPIDFEAVAALEPDLALATDQVNSPRDAETLEALGIPTYFLSFGSLEDVFDGLITIGELLGTRSTAVAAADSLREAVSALRARTDTLQNRPDVLLLIGRETLFSFGNESYVHEMIDLAGGHSLTAELDARAPVLSEEYVLDRKPDVILGPWGDDPDRDILLEEHPSWRVIPAVRDGRVYGMDGSLVERPGPRLVTGMHEMARMLHPTLFDQHPVERTSP